MVGKKMKPIRTGPGEAFYSVQSLRKQEAQFVSSF